MNTSTDWHLPERLSAPGVESWLRSLDDLESVDSVRLRLGRWHKSGPFADAYLQGALCRLAR